MEKNNTISWAELLKMPGKAVHTTIFLQVIVHFWRASSGRGDVVLPRDVSHVVLRPDHTLEDKARFHLCEVAPGDHVGIWDETPFWVDFCSDNERRFDHGDYRHAFQLFLRSFLRHTENHSSLASLRAIVSNFPILHWNCSLCRCYNDWSVDFMQKAVDIRPDVLRFLLTHKNDFTNVRGMTVGKDVLELIEASVSRFFSNFEKICSQTSADPTEILANLIHILDGYVSAHTTERLHEFEQECVRDMKTYLYKEFRFLKTAAVSVSIFPRDMMIARDLFPLIAASWADAPSSDTSPGFLMLLCHMLLEDRAHNGGEILLCQGNNVRIATPTESGSLTDYHPLLRQEIFVD